MFSLSLQEQTIGPVTVVQADFHSFKHFAGVPNG